MVAGERRGVKFNRWWRSRLLGIWLALALLDRDHGGSVLRGRSFHWSSTGLTPAISPNVGKSKVYFLLVGSCVRIRPLLQEPKRSQTKSNGRWSPCVLLSVRASTSAMPIFLTPARRAQMSKIQTIGWVVATCNAAGGLMSSLQVVRRGEFWCGYHISMFAWRNHKEF